MRRLEFVGGKCQGFHLKTPCSLFHRPNAQATSGGEDKKKNEKSRTPREKGRDTPFVVVNKEMS